MSGTYSFLDTQASFTGPGGVFGIGSSAGCAEEGIGYTAEDINIMTPGADSIMHSLRGVVPGTITVRLLKTSPTNQKLQSAYNTQKTSAQLHGNNVISVANSSTGDKITLTQAAFQKTPDNAYAKDGNILEWVFQGQISVNLGGGMLNSLA